MKKILKNWYIYLIALFFISVSLVYILFGGRSVIAVHDNLDLFIPQYKMMRDGGTFFAHGATVPFLGGLSRDYLPSEFNIVTVLYMVMPPLAAYIVSYLLKVAIAIWGACLLAGDVYKDEYEKYKPIATLVGFAYGILNLFPNFGIPFASVPLLVFIMRRIMQKPGFWWYAALFVYPFVSYFSYLGFFFIGYTCVFFIYRWCVSKKIPLNILLAIVVLSLGYVVFEYRLFSVMLFSDTVSIRETMLNESLVGMEVVQDIIRAFAFGDMHTESVQIYLVLPVCLIYLVVLIYGKIKNKCLLDIFRDSFCGVMAFIVFNSLCFGLFHCEPVRSFVEMILPPLKGFEFARTEFTNPFLWYLAFFIVLKRMYDRGDKWQICANFLALAAIGVILIIPTRYNDLLNTVYSKVYEMRVGMSNNNLTFDEYYSADLFDKAKADIGYSGEWSVAYGFYPAVLEYSDINTLDGYLGYYSKQYKDDFRRIIAPALERMPESRMYFDNSGIRCYMYSGTYPSITNAYRYYEYTDEDIYMDVNAFRELGGRYIFSRVALNNAEDIGLKLKGIYNEESSTYTLYVYDAD